MKMRYTVFLLCIVFCAVLAQRIRRGGRNRGTTTNRGRRGLLETFSNCRDPQPERICDPEGIDNVATGFRSLDGRCNNIEFSTRGAANTSLQRSFRARYERDGDTPRGFFQNTNLPSAREVSDRVFVSSKRRAPNEVKTSVMFMTFGQFLDHDMSLTPIAECDVRECRDRDEAFRYPCFPILGRNTLNTEEKRKVGLETSRRGSFFPPRQNTRQTRRRPSVPRTRRSRQQRNRPTRPLRPISVPCSPFGRSIPICQNELERRDNRPREQINIYSSYLDASQIYANTLSLNQRVRDDNGGLLRIVGGKFGLLPDDDEIEEICQEREAGCFLAGDTRVDENAALASMHTLWVREHNRIATELRRLNPQWDNEELFQNTRKIIGAIFQRITFKEFLPLLVNLPEYSGYNPFEDASIMNSFSTAAFRFGHSLVPNSFSLLNENFDPIPGIPKELSLRSIFFNSTVIRKLGIEPLVFGLIGNRSNIVDNEFAFDLVRRLFQTPEDKTLKDLTALNIQRGRDHGIPTYQAVRRACGLSVAESFEGLRQFSPEVRSQLDDVYRSVDDIDLFVGGISEEKRGESLVGPTFECLITEQFRRLRDGDRFYYENEGVFTREQRRSIERVTMASVLCNTLDGAVSIQRKVFETFTGSERRREECRNFGQVDLRLWREPNPSRPFIRRPTRGRNSRFRNRRF